MNSQDTNRDPEPLSQEERALGERLARLGPQGEPSPGLDARILAAAHAAASTPAVAYKAPRRWPMALGIAASLTLAVGIAWQLRPVQEATVYDEAASAAAAQAETPPMPQESSVDAGAGAAEADQAGAVAVEPARAADASSAQISGAGSRRESSAPVSAPRSAQRARVPAPAPPTPSEPEVVFDDAVPTVDVPIPAPAAPPAAPMRAPSPAPAAKAIAGETRAQAAERNSVEAASSEADTAASTAAGTATQSRDDALAEDVPPATADSPEVREAWLKRIRELAEAGDTGDAQASLQEFVRRYPNHPLPDDLRALLE